MTTPAFPKPGSIYRMRGIPHVLVKVQGRVEMRSCVRQKINGVVYRREGDENDTCRGVDEFCRLFELVG